MWTDQSDVVVSGACQLSGTKRIAIVPIYRAITKNISELTCGKSSHVRTCIWLPVCDAGNLCHHLLVCCNCCYSAEPDVTCFLTTKASTCNTHQVSNSVRIPKQNCGSIQNLIHHSDHRKSATQTAFRLGQSRSD